VEEICEAAEMGIISGVTTNPSLIDKEGRDYAVVLKEIAEIVKSREDYRKVFGDK
jgi:transaldolase